MKDQLDKWYKTPMSDKDGSKADGIFKFGIPRNVLHAMAEFWLQHPVLKPLRKEFENCKIMKQNPSLCISEGVTYAQTMNKLAEQPFTKCPKQTVGWIKCLDDNAKNFCLCRDLEVEWNACMKTHFDIHIPPFPLNPRRLEWNAGETAKYRMRIKTAGRDSYADFQRHIGIGLCLLILFGIQFHTYAVITSIFK